MNSKTTVAAAPEWRHTSAAPYLSGAISQRRHMLAARGITNRPKEIAVSARTLLGLNKRSPDIAGAKENQRRRWIGGSDLLTPTADINGYNCM